MSPLLNNVSTEQLDFIKTLEVEDILLLDSNHTVHKLYQEETKLQVNLKQTEDDNSITILDDFVIFNMSMQIELYEENSELNQENLLLESYAKFGAIYSYENLNGWKEEEIELLSINFFRYSAITHIMAFARQHFYTMTNKSGYPRLQIPLIKSMLDEEAENVASEQLKAMDSDNTQ